MRLDATVDWREVAQIVKRSYRMTAPKKVVATVDGGRRDKKYYPSGNKVLAPFSTERDGLLTKSFRGK
jgi:hypothetical protein